MRFIENIAYFILLAGGYIVAEFLRGYLYFLGIIILEIIVVSVHYLFSEEKTGGMSLISLRLLSLYLLFGEG